MTLSRPASRFEAAQAEIARASERIDELARQIPEPVANVAEAIKSLTPEERAALWAVRPDALQAIARHAADSRARLADVTERSRELQTEFHEAMRVSDFDRLSEIASWFDEHDEEVGQLIALVEELDALQQLLQENPVSPPPVPPVAR